MIGYVLKDEDRAETYEPITREEFLSMVPLGMKSEKLRQIRENGHAYVLGFRIETTWVPDKGE